MKEAATGKASAGDAHVLHGLSDLQLETCRMAQQAKHRILIYDGQLNRSVYGQSCFAESVKQLAIRHANTYVRILLAETDSLRTGGHQLLNMARRLPSSIEIRRREEVHAADLRGFMVVDDAGCLYYPVWYDLNGVVAHYDSRFRIRQLAADFDGVWEQSHVDPELNQLSI